MALFSRKPTQSGKTTPALLASGRRLQTSLAVGDARRVVEDVMESYGSRRYASMPHLVPAGYSWFGPPQEAPSVVLTGRDQQDDPLFLTFRSDRDASEIGIFPLGDGDQRLTMPVVGHIKQRDSSLRSIGSYPPGSIGLSSPPVSDGLVAESLTVAGYPATPENMAMLAEQLFVMTMIKAHQFISGKDGEAAGERYMRKWRTDPPFTQSLVQPIRMVLQDLANWDAGVLPYMQDVPLRVQGIVLEGSGEPGSFWDKLKK